MTDEERALEIDRLESLLSASQGMGGGYKERIEVIKERLKDLKNQDHE